MGDAMLAVLSAATAIIWIVNWRNSKQKGDLAIAVACAMAAICFAFA